MFTQFIVDPTHDWKIYYLLLLTVVPLVVKYDVNDENSYERRTKQANDELIKECLGTQ